MIDSHCHLAGDEFVNDLDEVIARAQAGGLRGALCIVDAASRVELDRVPGLRQRWPSLGFSVGVHPHRADASGPVEDLEALVRKALRATQACAVGEVGLDYHYDFAPVPVQLNVFATQVEVARALDVPVIVHTREADDDTIEVLREVGQRQVRGVLHCFTGGPELAAQALDLGFYLSFSGIVTFPRAGALRDVAAGVPRDRVLIETDSPYLAPVPHRGQRNEPARVAQVAETLAGLWGVSVQDVADQTSANFTALFGDMSGSTVHDGAR